MFEIGEYVVCGNNGVCLIQEITTLRMSGVDQNRKYYILKPVYSAGSTIYVPVDALQSSMRRILSKEEATVLLYYHHLHLRNGIKKHSRLFL